MASKIIKNILAISWISIVIFFYFKNHDYYKDAWAEIDMYLFYILLIPLLYACYALYQWFQKGEKKLKIKITTLRLLTAALLLILITGNAAFLIKSPSYYTGADIFYTENADGEKIISLVNDLTTLTGDETLVIGSNGAMEWTRNSFENWIPEEIKSYFILPATWQIEFGLITKTIGILLALGLITITAISFGFTILRKFLKKNDLNIETGLISLGLGFLGITILMFILGAFHILTMTTTWILFIALLGAHWKSLLQILKKIWKFEHTFETKIFNFNLLIILVLTLVLSINFIDNISPLPRGWDGMNQYVNIAKRIEEAQGLITMGGNYYWELFMSLGFIMFDWTTITLNLASFFPATLTLIGLYVVLRKFLSKSSSLIIASSIYLTPLYLFHGTEENKVDLANFAMSIIAFLSLYKGLTAESKREKFSFIAIAGLLAGFCFGIKLTSLILVFTFIILTLYKEFKKTGAIAGIMFSIGALAFANNINFGTTVLLSSSGLKIAGIILLLTSLGLITAKLIKHKGWRPIKAFLILIIFTGLAFSPWLIKNFSESHTLSTYGLLFGSHPQPTIDYDVFEEDYELDKSLCLGTGTHEELDRYLGYGSILENYLTLPWHLTMNDQGTKGIYVDFGWIPLSLLPALLLFIPFKKPTKKWAFLIIFTITYWLIWAVTSNGIIWYGLPGFLAIGLIIGGLIDNYQKTGKYHGHIIKIIVTIFLISSLVFRLSFLGKGTLLLYTADILNEEEAITAIFPHALEIHDIFEADQDGQYDLIWKVGTNLNYFLEDNFWRTYNDQYLDGLNCLYIERDPELLTERLKALGFGYIVFDYYTYSVSPDPDGTLWEKYSAALDYILNYTEMIVPDYYRGHIVAKIPGT